jgi:hypothetical protein
MSEILYDAKFSILDLSQSLSINEDVILDVQKNLNVNDIICNNVYCNQVIDRAIIDEQQTTRDFQIQENSLPYEGENNIFDPLKNSFVVSGEFNECLGTNSVIVGGKDNENNGECSVVLGGQNNQCIGDYTTVMGTNSVAEHNNSFVWSSDSNTITRTTKDSQCILNAKGGVMFKLPKSGEIWNEHLNEGFACMCWDVNEQKACIKTKQNGVTYKSYLTTQTNEISVNIKPSLIPNQGVNVSLINPDYT